MCISPFMHIGWHKMYSCTIEQFYWIKKPKYIDKGMNIMEYLKEYEKWCESPEFDEETKKELLEIKDNEKEIEDRFYKELEFGTAGLRGVIGAGTNRMNKYTVGKATQGLANYILECKQL